MNTISCHAHRSHHDDIDHRRDLDHHRLTMVTKHHRHSLASSSSCPPSLLSAENFGSFHYDAQPKKHPDRIFYSYGRRRLFFLLLLLLTGSCDGMKNTTTNNIIHRIHHEISLHDTYHAPRMTAATDKTDIKQTNGSRSLGLNNLFGDHACHDHRIAIWPFSLEECQGICGTFRPCNYGLVCARDHQESLKAAGLDSQFAYCPTPLFRGRRYFCYDPKKLPATNCVYNQNDILYAISNNWAQIDLCTSYITLDCYISVKSKSVDFTCNLAMTNGAKCILDAQRLSRHFYAKNATINFYDVVFINGYRSGFLPQGGAIFITGYSTLFAYRCDFMNNSARSGGAIASYDSNAILTGGEANAALAENNEAKYLGGFLFALNSTINITNHLFLHNSAATAGGAIHIQQSSTLSTYRCDFRNNSAADNGGVISSYDSTLNLTDGETKVAVAENNRATFGGFLLAFSSTINLTNHLFRNNSAAKAGGAIYIDTSSALSTYRCDFMNNSAFAGGAIYSHGSTLILTGGEAKAAVAENNEATDGGGFLGVFNSTVSITNHLFLHNSAGRTAGAIYMDQSSTLSTYRCSFINNFANWCGAINSFYSILTMTGSNNSVGENNEAMFIGGFLCAISSTINITNSSFLNNVALGEGGGGANVQWNSSSYYENVVFQNNSASLGEGGALMVLFEDIALNSVVFKDNNATNGTIRSYSSQIDLTNYSFLSSDPIMDPCDLSVSQFRHTYDQIFTNNFSLSFDDGFYLASCINFPTLIAINNRRLDTKSIQDDSHKHSIISDPNDQMYPSDYLLLTTNTSSDANFSLSYNSTPRGMLSSTCVSSSTALRNSVQSAKPGTKTTIKVCTGRIALGGHARRLQYGNSSLLTNMLDGIDISNKNIVFVCSRKRRRNAHLCTLDAGGVMRHFYGSDSAVQFHNIRFVNGYHQGAGGALLINNSDVTITMCSFWNNTALSGAGAVFVNQTKLIMNGMETNVSQNRGSGAPIEIHSSNATVENVTFADNTMSQFGDGIFVFDSNVDLSNLSFNQSSSNMRSNCSLFVSVDPSNRTTNATCVAL